MEYRNPKVENQRKTKVNDMGNRIPRVKWRWAGHLGGREDGRWTKTDTE